MSFLPKSSPLIAAILALCACGGLSGSGKVVTEARTVEAFTKVAVADGIRTTISAGKQAISVTADDNLVAEIDTQVKDGTLTIRLKQPIHRATQLNVDLNADVVTSVNASGGSRVRGLCTGATDPSIEASGGSTIEFSDLAANSVTVDASGGSEVTLAGTVNTVTLNASGGSQFTSSDLNADKVTLDASGGAVVKLRANASVDGEASGGAVVRILGPAALNVKTSGGSVVSKDG